MSKKRRTFSDEFKTKVVLEIMKERETLSEIGSKYNIHPNQLLRWKKEFMENAVLAFSKSDPDKKQMEKDFEQQKGKLYKKIGQLQVEVDFLKKKSDEILGE